MRRILLTIAFLSSAVLASAAQTAEAALHTKLDGDTLRVAIAIDIEPGAHLYHGPTKADLGHPDAVGAPTTVALEAENVEFGPVWFPEPEQLDQSDFGPGVFINAHEGHLVLYAAGRVAPGAQPGAVRANVKGLVCDAMGCMPWKRTLSDGGEGDAGLWADFPGELLADLPAAAQASAPTPAPFTPKRDEKTSGEADATLYTRIDPADPTKVRAAIQIEITPGWHLYHEEKGNPDGIGLPTRIELRGEGIEWGDIHWPEPEKMDQSDIIEGAWIYGHEGTIVLYAEGELRPGANPNEVSAKLTGQTCEDACVGYAETAHTKGPGPDSVWAGWDGAMVAKVAESAAGAGAVEEEVPAEEDQSPLWRFLLEAVVWGLITLLMPCTYPMIPITISFFTKQADARGGNVLPLSLAYGTGIVLVFALIGVVIGPAIVPFAQGGLLNLIIGILFLYFALVLLGYVNLQPPRFLMNAAGKASMKGGYLGVFLMGTCLVVTSFTCTAPFVGTLLARGASDGDLMRVVLGMGVFGLTMAIPFVVLSLVPGRVQALPKSGAWMNTLKVTLGFVELAAAFKFFSNTDLAWGWNVISREAFLFLWALIFFAAALYLWGILRLKGQRDEIGPVRRLVSVFFLAFAIYCGVLGSGREADYLMSSMAPPYSGGRFLPALHESEDTWTIIEDDYHGALARAKEEGKLLFINFTGHT
ncbi:MAG TPA: hypothetical protein ENJ09_13385 [Planctomycetes bacterium]|nr:hypothetical protein [Planctomycetota bacterium]